MTRLTLSPEKICGLLTHVVRLDTQAAIAMTAICEALTLCLLQTAFESEIRAAQTRLEERKTVKNPIVIRPHGLMIAMTQDAKMNSFFLTTLVHRGGISGGIQKALIPGMPATERTMKKSKQRKKKKKS